MLTPSRCTRVTNVLLIVLIRDEAAADGMGLFEAARLVGLE